MLLDYQAGVFVKKKVWCFVVECWKQLFRCFLGIVRIWMEGEKGEDRVLLAKGREEGKRNYISSSSRYWVSTLHVFHHQRAHASRHRAKCIATFGSFVKQYRGVLTNKKRRWLGRATHLAADDHDAATVHLPFILPPAAENENSYHANT